MSQVTVTISDEEYSQMLQDRLAAKHGFDAGTTSYEEYMATRAIVRRARKIRKAEGAVVENYRQQSAPQHQAMTRKPQSEDSEDWATREAEMDAARYIPAMNEPEPEQQVA